jgi:iron-sulfur cluster assembly accessory protein
MFPISADKLHVLKLFLFSYVQGMTIDYVRNGLNEGFEFRNPNERDRCGCGESFRV